MKHFYKEIKGWSKESMQGELIKEILNRVDSDYLKVVEVGVYFGRSMALWGVELVNSGIDFEYIGIDHFKGSKEHKNKEPNYKKALENLKPLEDYITLKKMSSEEASKLYEDETFDIIYIDASHEYDSVIKDINLWLPKVKKGGFLCGDDYHRNWKGVKKAVNGLFGDNYEIIGDTQWLVQK